VALAAAALALSARAEPPETWVVKPGDTCVSISRAIWGGREGLQTLHALNDLGPPPHRLVPGTVLRLRAGPVAQLTLVRPRVETRAPGAAEWTPAAAGLGLHARSQLTTLDRAGAEVTFADTSRLVLRENAFAIIYGPLAARPRAPDRSGQVELVQGEATVSLAALRGESARVATPGARLSAASREVVVAVDGAMSRVSVLDGRAEVSARGRVIALAEGEGTRVEQGKAPEPARKLPAAPVLSGGRRRVLLAGDPAREVRLAWAPVPGAARYRVEVARDERFADRVLARELAAEAAPATVLAGLEPGRVRARVRSVDVLGLVGPASSPLVLDVVALRLEQGAPVPGGVRGDREVRLALEAPPEAADLVLTVDGSPVRSPLTLSAPGLHTIRLAAPGAGDEDALTLAAEVVAPPPPPAQAPAPAPPPREPSGPILGARLALVAGRGGLAEAGPLSSHATVELHAGWRVSRFLSLTAFGSHGPGALALPSCGPRGCADGSASAAGFEAAVDLAPSATASPWLGAGAGIEWLELPSGGARRSTTLLRLAAGVDGELLPGLSGGPYFGWSLGRPEAADPGAAGRSLHGWFTVGLRGTFEPARR